MGLGPTAPAFAAEPSSSWADDIPMLASGPYAEGEATWRA